MDDEKKDGDAEDKGGAEKKPKKPPPVPSMNRAARRALKGERMKLLQGGRRPDAPSVDMSQPAGRFAYHLHSFIVQYMVKNPDLERTAACAAALQVAAKFGVELGGDEEGFVVAARHFFAGEAHARMHAPEPGPEVG